LKARLETVLGLATGAGATAKMESVAQSAEAAPLKTAEPEVLASAPQPEISSTDDDDDTLSYFAKLAAEE
jgi:hypothetical protein